MTALIEGIGVTTSGNGDLQAAIESADESYYKRYNRPATYVSLPTNADTEGLMLWPLRLAPAYGVGVVIVGRLQGDNGGDGDTRQMNLGI